MSMLKLTRFDDLKESEYELEITFKSEKFFFSSRAYVNNSKIGILVHELEKMLAGRSLFDFQIGGFGPEYAGGASLLRFHRIKDVILITIHMQGRHCQFDNQLIAAEFKNYMHAKVTNLTSFSAELQEFFTNARAEASCNVIQFTDN